MKRTCLGLLAILLCSVSQADSAADVKAWNDEYWNAWDARDVEKVANLFSEDVEIVWPYKEETASGRDEFLKLLEWEFSFPSTQIDVEQISQKIYEMDHDSLLVLDLSKQTFADPDGNPMTVLVRATSLYRRVGDRLEFVKDHASVAQPWEEQESN